MKIDDGHPGNAQIPGDGSKHPSVLVASAELLRVETRLVEHPSIPEGASGLASFIRGRLVARQPMSRETIATYEALLSVPRRVAYVAYEKEDGSVEGQLAAVTSPSEVREAHREEEREPWKASVPSFEESVGTNEESDDDNHVALLPLGTVVRIRDRRSHPDDLAKEAADILRTLVNEGAVEVVDQFLDTI